LTASLQVVLVRPKEDGNVGAVARLARNFGAEGLTIVQPRAKLGAEARRRAMGGLGLLKNSSRAATLSTGVKDCDLIVGTSDTAEGRSSAYWRRSISPERLGELLRPVQGKVALVFGPEDDGLHRDELEKCDLLVHVPASRESPTLNLSHAVGLVLYAIHRSNGDGSASTPESDVIELRGREKELFQERIAELLNRIGYPPHKRKGLVLLFRRLLGRATPAEGEYRMLLGFVKQLNFALARKPHGRRT
jgi:tRNA/rRNA methyltransferase